MTEHAIINKKVSIIILCVQNLPVFSEFAGLASDLERGGISPKSLLERPPLSVIVPVYRRDCQEEVYAGSHAYPGQGVYLLKFDNSYSFWRSKTVYYRVYYTR